jgi:hypothetical protein
MKRGNVSCQRIIYLCFVLGIIGGIGLYLAPLSAQSVHKQTLQYSPAYEDMVFLLDAWGEYQYRDTVLTQMILLADTLKTNIAQLRRLSDSLSLHSDTPTNQVSNDTASGSIALQLREIQQEIFACEHNMSHYRRLIYSYAEELRLLSIRLRSFYEDLLSFGYTPMLPLIRI